MCKALAEILPCATFRTAHATPSSHLATHPKAPEITGIIHQPDQHTALHISDIRA